MIPNLPDYARLIKERVGLHFDNAMEALLKTETFQNQCLLRV